MRSVERPVNVNSGNNNNNLDIPMDLSGIRKTRTCHTSDPGQEEEEEGMVVRMESMPNPRSRAVRSGVRASSAGAS